MYKAILCGGRGGRGQGRWGLNGRRGGSGVHRRKPGNNEEDRRGRGGGLAGLFRLGMKIFLCNIGYVGKISRGFFRN